MIFFSFFQKVNGRETGTFTFRSKSDVHFLNFFFFAVRCCAMYQVLFWKGKIKKMCMILNPQLVLVIWCNSPFYYNFQILWKSNLFHLIWKNYVLSILRFRLEKLNFWGFFSIMKKHHKIATSIYFFNFILEIFFSKQKHLNLFFHITLTFAQINLDKWLAYVRKKMSGLIFFFRRI